MFFKKKKYFLFTLGSYFWGYEHILIKAKDESSATGKFLQDDVQNQPLKYPHESNGKRYSYIKDYKNWVVKEIEVIK